ncbi:MAG: hypothetical protein AAF664_14450 [Planctomycetota bacterium]
MTETGVYESLGELYKDKYDNNEAVTRKPVISANESCRETLRIIGDGNCRNALDVGVGDVAVLQALSMHEQIRHLSAVEISQSGVTKIEERELPKLEEV